MGRRRTPAERDAIVAAFQRSGLTQRAFASDVGVNVNTLRGWIYERRPREVTDAPQPAFLEVARDDVPAPPRWTVRVGDGPELVFDDAPDPRWFAQVVTALSC